MNAYLTLIGFSQQGWGRQLLQAMSMTLAVSIAAFCVGLLLGLLGAWGSFGGRGPRAASRIYTTVLRGVPELLVIYLFYFGGSAALTGLGHLFGAQGFLGLSGFMVGALSVGVVSGAYQTEVLRGAYNAIPRGELEAATAVGMGRLLMLRRIIAPQALRFALPGLGNVWQTVLKESALISVTGLVEIMRMVGIAANSTRLPFDFFLTGAAMYLCLTAASGLLFRAMERRVTRGMAT
jgi:octopine/nopaline transport system permease protein